MPWNERRMEHITQPSMYVGMLTTHIEYYSHCNCIQIWLEQFSHVVSENPYLTIVHLLALQSELTGYHNQAIILLCIGTCRVVWVPGHLQVPGQDLAMSHLMRNCGKCFFVTILCAIYMSVRA